MNKNYFEIFILIIDIEKSLTINVKCTRRIKALRPNVRGNEINYYLNLNSLLFLGYCVLLAVIIITCKRVI